MESLDWTMAAVLAAYNLALVGVGVWASRRATSEQEFLLAGGGLGPIVAGLAYAASTSSAWVLLGFTGFVAVAGVSALWMVPGILAGYALVWLWAGPMLGRSARERGALTLLDVVTDETGPKTARAIKIVSATLIGFCFLFYIGAQFQAAGQALSGALSIPFTAALVLGAGVIAAYTLLGGIHAVSITDTFQGLAIVAVAVVLPIGAFLAVGGVEGLAAGLAAATEPKFFDPVGGAAGWAAFGFAAGLAATGFGALGQPHLVTWVMAVRDARDRRIGAVVALVWGVLVYAGMALLALCARAMAEPGAVLGETIALDLAQVILPGVLPALVYAAILSAIMSTVDSQILVASAAVSHDLGLAKRAPGREVMITRAAILVLTAGAIALTLVAPASIFNRVLFAWSALGAAFGPVVIALAFGWRPAGPAILASICIGFSMAAAANLLFPSPGAWLERIAPWAPALAILWFARRPVAHSQPVKEAAP